MRRTTTYAISTLALIVLFHIACALRAQPTTVGAARTYLYLPSLQGKRVALVANQASRVGERHLLDTLLSLDVAIKKIFCPEHGFRGDVEAGGYISNGTDPVSGIELVSLYGKNKKPTAAQLNDVDVVVFDLQDVGCRFYTYISTLHYVMEACAENRIKMILLDRPNPNGDYVDGPVLDSNLQTFVGMHPVPIVYGMTIGEYALMINGEQWLREGLHCDINVVPLLHWTHDSIYHLPVAPSPNLATQQAIRLYPTLCLFEGTDISVGRGTESPFCIIGHPQFACRETDLPNGVAIAEFTPHPIKHVSENPPHKNQRCRGLDLGKITPPQHIDLSYLLLMYQSTPRETFFLRNRFFDNLAGTRDLRQQIEQGLTAEEIRASWEPALEKFRQVRKKYLLYN